MMSSQTAGTEAKGNKAMSHWQIAFLCNNIRMATATVVIGIVLIGWVFIDIINPVIVCTWMATGLLISAMRLYIHLWAEKQLKKPETYQRITVLIIAATLSIGAFWGLGAVWISSYTDIFYWIAWLGILVGYAAGASYSTAASITLFKAYVFPALMPMAAFLLLHDDKRTIVAGTFLMMFMAGVWHFARKSHAMLQDRQKVAAQNISLTEQLTHRNQQLKLEKQQTEEHLKQLAQFSGRDLGIDFFHSLSQEIAVDMHVHIAFVAELSTDHDTYGARSLALWINGKLVDNIIWSMHGTPCQQVAEGHACTYPDQLQVLFPDDLWLQEVGAQSYVGIPMFSSEGLVIGHLGAMDNKPMANPQRIQQMLQIFANRSAAELERRHTEQALRLTQDSVDHSSDAIFWLDQQANIIKVNQTACQRMGYASEELTAMTAFDVNPTITPERWNQLWQSGQQEPLRQIQSVLRNKAGALIPVEMNCNPVMFDGKAYQVVYAADISQQKKSDEASQAKSQFLETMSHELRTPLHGLAGLQSMLRSQADYLQPEHRTLLDLAIHSAQTLQLLIDDVLDLSKIESGKIELSPQTFDLPTLLREMLIPFIVPAAEKEIDMQLSYQDIPLRICMDQTYLRQILLNLTGNALKFTDQGFIYIQASYAAGLLSIAIEDSGIGIAASDQDRLFQPFQQLSQDASRQGTGLGCTIAQRLAGIMDGRILLHSEPGKGSTFTLIVPVLAVGEACISGRTGIQDILADHATAQRSAVVPDCCRSLRILLAEDDEISRMITLDSLSRAGLQVDTACTGLEAWEKVQVGQYDLLLTDIRMPGLDGIELTGRIRALEQGGNHRTRIIGLSAHAMASVMQQCMAEGMDDFISKPIQPDALLRRIS